MESKLVKNEHLLNLQPDKLETLRTRAELHRRYSSIDFKVISYKDDTLTLRVIQDKSHAGNYFDAKRLVEIAKEMFGDLGDWKRINAGPITYKSPAPDVVTPEWIQERMQLHGLKPKAVSDETGIDRNTISAYKNGLKPLSGVVRAFWYYYFKSKQ
jgi:hypothetical protein